MSEGKFKVIVLTHGGGKRLLELLSAQENLEIAGVFVEAAVEPTRSLKQKFERSIRYDGYWPTTKKLFAKVFGGKTRGADELESLREGQAELKKFANELGIPIAEVQKFHDDSSMELLCGANADLGILYGTNIIKEPVFSIPRLGSINIHQGLAPYYRGGPPLFWELFNGENEVGITVHFVAAEVDTGDIIVQRSLPLRYDFARYGLDHESFVRDYRATMTEPTAQLIVDAVGFIAEGIASPTKQDTSLGKRYRLPVKAEKDALLRILRKRQEQEGPSF